VPLLDERAFVCLLVGVKYLAIFNIGMVYAPLRIAAANFKREDI
jgi:hypothetical protein